MVKTHVDGWMEREAEMRKKEQVGTGEGGERSSVVKQKKKTSENK